MLRLGVQYVRPDWPTEFMARASVEIAVPRAANRVRLKDWDECRGCGKEVAAVTSPSKSTPGELATP
jgi:hypothetical protein